MSEQTIKPVVPVTRTRDVIKKRKPDDQKHPPSSPKKDKESNSKKKGIVDTYA